MRKHVSLVQIVNKNNGARKVAKVNEPDLYLLRDFAASYDLIYQAIKAGVKLSEFVEQYATDQSLSYDEIYEGRSEWELLSPVDHPDPNHCLLSGTGLTHKSSAEKRQQMHGTAEGGDLTDSMKMFLWGLEGGKPVENSIGIQPEWFYKGNGNLLKGHGDVLEVPSYATDGGEEPEIAGVYIIDPHGKPWRVGMVTANEFSDHVMEKKNYLYLAPSKIRNCSIGPELILNPDFIRITGNVTIYRNGEVLWEKEIFTGEENMSHSLENLEHHNFKYKSHRVPGQLHIHFLGADNFSFGEGISLKDGDIMKVQWNHFGRALINEVKIIRGPESKYKVRICS